MSPPEGDGTALPASAPRCPSDQVQLGAVWKRAAARKGRRPTVRCTRALRLAEGVGETPTHRRYRTTKDDGDVYDGRDDCV